MTAVSGRRSTSTGSTSGTGPNAQQAMFSAGRGLFLILLAIAIGIVLLYVIDDGSTGPATATGTTTGRSAPTTTAKAGTPTTTAAATTRPPADVKIKVYNAGRPQGTASKMTDQLRTRGYTNALGVADLRPAQAGTSVACQAGYEGADAAALAAAVGPNTKVVTWPNPPPTGAGEANCVVILGT